MHPSKTITLGFSAAILLGTLLLLLPGMAADGGRLPPIDALFTATSAICVTGLVTLSIADDFSLLGQATVLLLAQIGGLGIMTMTAAFLVLLRRKLDRTAHFVMRDTYSGGLTNNMPRLLRRIVYIVLIAEGIGAILLFAFVDDGRGIGFRAWTAVFHSVSGFCNAGFSLYNDSLMAWGNNYAALSVMMILIVLGGLGFFVVVDVHQYLYGRGRVLAIQTKIVLVMTAVLIVVGTVGVWVAERPWLLRDAGGFEAWFHSLFQSITARSAGFSTMPIGRMSDIGMVVLMALMLIGGSPGSVAGGIKTTTAAIAIMTIYAHLRGRDDVEIFRRRIPTETVQRSFFIILVMMLLIALAFIVLRAGKHYGAAPEDAGIHHHLVVMPLGFEVISAACIVGLSADFTPRLTPVGKIVVILLMFAGRLGPLTLAFAFVDAQPRAAYRLPEEPVMVG